jgi:hypothetical protein
MPNNALMISCVAPNIYILQPCDYRGITPQKLVTEDLTNNPCIFNYNLQNNIDSFSK